jgi:general stress protein YciG
MNTNADNKGQQNQNQGGGQRMSDKGSQGDSQNMRENQNQGGNQNTNSGQFSAKDPKRAQDMGRKGGQS